MNNYEEIFADIIDMFSPTGIWIKNNALRIGFNFMEITNNGDGSFSFNDETDDFDVAIDVGIEEYLDADEDLMFCFSLDRALLGNFVNWGMFCKMIDEKQSFDDILTI